MNIIDIQDNLKNLPEQALMQEMQQPTGSAPQFLVLGELKRRKQMRDDYNRQKNADMKTVAEEVVTAAGAPQEGIMQMARSLNPNTNMAQDTGLAQATPVTPTQAPQPQAPQMMSDGGIMRMARGGRFGTDIEYNYKTFLQENNLNDTPYAQDMFARLKETMDDRYDADGPNNNPRIYDNAIGFERSPEGLASVSSDVSDFTPSLMSYKSRFVNPYYSMGRPLNQGLERMGFGDYYEVGPQLPEGTDALFTPQTSPAAPMSTLDQLRSSVYSSNPLEDALANTGLNSNVIGDDIIDPVISRFAEAASREGMRSQTAADIANETALRNREMASENAGRLTAEELLAPAPRAYDVTDTRSGRPRAQGIASFGVFDPIVDRFKEIRSEDAARNAAAAEGDLGAFLDVGSENNPAFVEKATEIFGNPVERFKSEMAARQAAGERNYANTVQGVEALNQRIADAEAAGDKILAQQLTIARDQLGRTLLDEERKEDVTEWILGAKDDVNKAFQQSSLGVRLRGPDATARTLTALEAEQEAAKKAEATRERRLAELLGGATPTVMDAAEAAQEEFDQRPDTQDVKPAAESQRIAEAIEATTTAPVATKDTTRDTTTDTSASTDVGSSGRIAKMLEDRQKSAESDKWMALAQTGLALMASNQPTLGGAIGEAGLAGIGALQQSRQGMQDFEMDMLKLQTQIDAANRKSDSKGGLTAGNIISYVDDLARQQSDIQDKLDELDTGVFMGTEEQKEAIRKRLQTNLFQVNLELSTYRNALRGGQPSSGSTFDVTGGSQSTGN